MAMTESSATIQDGLKQFTARGYTGQFRTTKDGLIHCFGCERDLDPTTIRLDELCRVEGASDPSDEVLVAAMTCSCGSKGTEVFTYGPNADPMEADALRALEDGRKPAD